MRKFKKLGQYDRFIMALFKTWILACTRLRRIRPLIFYNYFSNTLYFSLREKTIMVGNTFYTWAHNLFDRKFLC